MSDTESAVEARSSAGASPRLNRFTIQVATVNGSGSQTANNTLLRALFRMGLPVSGKNLFPSNIAGLPTWFTIRVDADGYIGRRPEVDVLVCMNAATAEKDVNSLPPGATVVYEEKLRVERYRDDVLLYPVPFSKLVKEVCEPVALRKLVVNMVYVGVVMELLGIDPEEIESALGKAFSRKPKALGLNRDAVSAGATWVRENVESRPAVAVERANLTDGKILVEGNRATAVGALMAGATVCTWYPITPSSSVAEGFTSLARRYRTNRETGETTAAIVQAEDELAAVGMVLGAGWAGARSFTATSGPGISLMSEFVGLGHYAEIPAVIVNVQRAGPSTGLPTRTQQADVLSTACLSHGDGKHPCLYPANIEEAYGFTVRAFDLAETLQTPVFVLTDLDLGMNLWMSEPFPYPEEPITRGKVLDAEALAKVEDWGRYRDVDGDAIPYRTLPGMTDGKGAYFTRGTGHNEYGGYTEDGGTYVRNVDRLARKFETAAAMLPAPVEDGRSRPVGLLAYGTSHHAIVEARDGLKRDHGFETDYLRVCAYPFHADVQRWIEAHERVYVVEQNRDAQMRHLLAADFPEFAPRLRSILHYDGMPLAACDLIEALCAQESTTGKGGA